MARRPRSPRGIDRPSVCTAGNGIRAIGWMAAGVGALLATYVKVIRPWHLTWGATAAEAERQLPGDDILPDPKIRATHAVTIHAPASAVWPWLVQIGQGRAGFYSYDWIENLMRLGIHSSDEILPEFQQLGVGNVLPLAPNGFGPEVAILEPHRVLVLRGDTRIPGPMPVPTMKPGDYLAVLWGFYLEPVDGSTTRLIERFQMDYNPSPLNAAIYRGFLEPGSFVMEQKMLRGIKARAEAME